jgi:hypothetical protein
MLAVASSHSAYRGIHEYEPVNYFSSGAAVAQHESSSTSTDSRPTKKKPSRAKTVRFAAAVKVHDGLTPHKRIYDEVVHDLFNRPDDRYRTIRDVVTSANVRILQRLQEQLVDLMERCSEGKTPVLNCGGGRNNVVDERFAPWLVKLSARVDEHIEIIQEHLAECDDQDAIVRLRLGDAFRI